MIPGNVLPSTVFPVGDHVLTIWHSAPEEVARAAGKITLTSGDTGSAFTQVSVDVAGGTAVLTGDPLGRRALFFAAVPGGWIWSEDLGPLAAISGGELERSVLPAILHYRRTLGSRTVIAGIGEVPPLCEAVLGPRAVVRRSGEIRFEPRPATEPLEVWANRLEKALDQSLARVRSRYARVAVPLSGGLDSALLAAAAAQAGFERVVAVSAEIEGSDNEELRRARLLAAHLGIEHHVVRVDDRMLAASAESVLTRLQMLPRNHSDFVLHALLEAAAGSAEAVLYGEAGDTMFGPALGLLVQNVATKRRWLRWLPRQAQKLLARPLLRSRRPAMRRVGSLLGYNTCERAARAGMIESLTPPSALLPRSDFEPPEPDESVPDCDSSRGAAMEWVQLRSLTGSCRIHWRAVERMAAPLGLGVEIPFVSPEVMEVGLALPSAYKRRGDLHKPLVRALAGRAAPEGYAGLPKLGFPVPVSRWLAGSLKDWVDEARKPDSLIWRYLDRDASERLAWPQDYELVWTVTMLERLARVFLANKTAAGRSDGPPVQLA